MDTTDDEALLTDHDDPVIVIGAEPPRARLLPQTLAVLITCLAPLSMGMALGFSSPTTQSLRDSGLLATSSEVSWYASLITVGAIIGGPVAGVTTEKLGRKTTLLMLTVPFTAGWLMIILAESYILLFCGRLLTGVATGMCSLATPMYIAEISTKELRGTFGSAFQLFVTIGILAVYCLGIPFGRKWLAVCCSAVSGLCAVTVLLIPETPRWLIKQRLRAKGLLAIRWLRGRAYDIEEECLEVEANLQSPTIRVGFRNIFCRKALLKPLVIGLAMMLFQQASGINVFIFYTGDIFRSAGYKSNAHLPTVIVGGVQVAFTLLACLLMDRAGRRVLLIIGGVFMMLSSAAFGLYYYLTLETDIQGLSWLSLTSLIVFIMAFSVSWGPIPWLIISEIFPAQARGLASSLATMFNWTCAFIITSQYDNLQAAVHPYGAMWCFSGATFAGTIFVAFCLIETKSKSLEEIQEHFEGQ